jgi:c-di-GMP-binding flagellar brake protein YcgR
LFSVIVVNDVQANAPQRSFGGQRLAGFEKRRDPRIDSYFNIWCESDTFTSLGRVWNFSRGGLFVSAAYELERGSRLTLSHQDQDGKFVATPAEVVWRRERSARDPAGMGLRFSRSEEGLRFFELFRDQSENRSRDGSPVIK